MPNQISNVSFMGDEYGAEYADILRRMKLAELLQQQGMTGLGPTETVGGWAVKKSPMEGIAKIAQAGAGAYQQSQLDERTKALAAKMREGTTQDLEKFQNTMTGVPGQPEIPMPPDELGGGPGRPEQAAIPGNPNAAYAGLASSQNPMLRQAALARMLKGQEPVSIGSGGLRLPDGTIVPPAARPETGYTLGPEQTRFDPTNQPIATGQPKPQKDEGAWSEPYAMGGAFVQRNSVTGQVRQAVGREPQIRVESPPPITAVTIQDPKNPNATIVVDGRSGRVIGPGPKLTATGQAEQKLSLTMPQARLRVESMSQNMDRLDTALNELNTDPGLSSITGTVMGRTPNITNRATGAQAKLESIKSQIFQSSLQAMREASKTGGAVGNVSDREGDKLERTLAALDQAQGTAAFKGQLKRAIEQVRLSKQLINNAFQEQYGGVESRNSPAPAGSDVRSQADKILGL